MDKYVPRWERPQACSLPASAHAVLVAPTSAHQVSRKYLTQMLGSSALDTKRISSGSVADSHRIRDRYATDRNFIDGRTS
jgi:hypothetical protein